MNTSKTIKSLAVILLSFSAVALAGLNINQYRQIQLATERQSSENASAGNSLEVSMAEKQMSIAGKVPPDGIVSSGKALDGSNETEELIYHLESAEEELAQVQEQLAEDQAKKAERQKIEKELQKKYREDPSFKKAMKKSLDIQYADLFKKLNLSPEKLEMFKDLLLEEMMAQQDIYMDLDNPGNPSAEEQEEIHQRYQAMREEYDAKKIELLGESDHATYQAYSATEHLRYQVNAFLASMDSDERLTDTQKESLIEAMNIERQHVQFETIESSEDSSSSIYDENNIEAMLKSQANEHDSYLKAANSILSASQLEQFEGYLDGQLEQQRLFFEMMALRNASEEENANVVVVTSSD